MPGYTPNYAIPYPIATDPLDDAVSVIPQALATQVESTIASIGGVAAVGSWQGLAWSGFSNFGSGYQNGNYRKIGTQVFWRGALQNTSGATKVAGTSLGTLPVGYRPPTTVRVYVGANPLGTAAADNSIACVQIANTGVMTLLTDVPSLRIVFLDPARFFTDA